MKHLSLSLVSLALLGLCAIGPIQAQVAPAPSLLNFQGRLAKPDGTPVANGTYSVRFSLWDTLSGGAELWNQTINNIQVTNGAFAVLLNTSTGPATLFNNNLYLEIKLGADAPLTPRQQLVSVAFAMKANSVPDSSIGTASLANNAVNNEKLASDALSLNKVSGGAVISNGGKIGVGASNPGMSLEVTTPSYYGGPALGIGFGATRWAYLHTGASDPSFIWNSGSGMRFGTETARGFGYAEAMRVTSDGKLAIGTATATSPLTFRNADERKITLWETSDSNNRFYGIDLLNGRVRHWTGTFGSFEVGNYNNADGAFLTRFRVTNNGTVNVYGSSPLEFGSGVAGKQVDAGKIGYQTFSNDSLDIVGAGTTGTDRRVRFFSEGGTAMNGPLSLSSPLKDVLGAASNNTIGTWLNLTNTSAGGRAWSLISAGSANGEGAGTLVFHTQGITAAQLKSTGEFIANVVTVLGGSDVAEPYNVAAAGDVKAAPGMLVAIDTEKVGQMRVVSKAYDTAVAGIISGANGVNPGITLRQKGTVADGELPVASIGRVWCWCDADANGPVLAGDLLTSSNTPGHAMKATDRERRDGAVIGKAMSSLKSGKGLVLVLVSLK